MNQENAKPTEKVAAGGIGGAIAVLLIFIAGQFNIDITPEVASAVTVLVAFASSYIKKES